jgi:hypothetical protein
MGLVAGPSPADAASTLAVTATSVRLAPGDYSQPTKVVTTGLGHYDDWDLYVTVRGPKGGFVDGNIFSTYTQYGTHTRYYAVRRLAWKADIIRGLSPSGRYTVKAKLIPCTFELLDTGDYICIPDSDPVVATNHFRVRIAKRH